MVPGIFIYFKYLFKVASYILKGLFSSILGSLELILAPLTRHHFGHSICGYSKIFKGMGGISKWEDQI